MWAAVASILDFVRTPPFFLKTLSNLFLLFKVLLFFFFFFFLSFFFFFSKSPPSVPPLVSFLCSHPPESSRRVVYLLSPPSSANLSFPPNPPLLLTHPSLFRPGPTGLFLQSLSLHPPPVSSQLVVPPFAHFSRRIATLTFSKSNDSKLKGPSCQITLPVDRILRGVLPVLIKLFC